MVGTIRVLHIDESETDRALVCEALEIKSGRFEFDQADSWQQSKELLATKVYDIVISEINVSGFLGLDVLDQIKKYSPNLPVIIMTGKGSEIIAVEAMKNGALDYVVKTPENIRHLPQTILAVIDQSKQNKSEHGSTAPLEASRTRYEALFNDSPVPLWEEEFHELLIFLKELKSKGVNDLRKYLDENPDELKVCSQKIAILDVNKAAIALHGAKSKEDLIANLSSTFTEKSFLVFKEEVIALAEGQTEFQSEAEVMTLQGELRFVFLSLTLYTETEDQCRALLATTDITNRKQAEIQRERLMSAMEATRDAVVITNTEGSIQYVNSAFENISGFSQKETLNRNPRILKSGKHNKAFYEDMWSTLTSGHTWSGRIVNKRKDGTFFTEDTSISPVRDSLGEIVSYVGVKRDVSAEILMENKLRQAQKMESIGLLAGGVAHDFNNMLAVIMGNADLALYEVPKIHPAYPLLKGIRSATERSANLVSQLLAFARKQTIVPKVLDLNEAVEGILKMMRRLIGEDIDLAWLPGNGVPLVKMDPSQIDQILANLCVNARDAIGGVGKVTVETSFIDISEDHSLDHPDIIPGHFVMLAISDNGSGMDKDTLERIFEPFFSTKEQGEGTGLGLATVYGIVKQNGGFINAYSEPGEGTIFKIYFPREMEEPASKSEVDSTEMVRGGHESILVVEDEPAILELASRILSGKGYSVTMVVNPVDAIELVENSPDAFDLVLTDVILPNMSGNDLVNRLQDMCPGIKHLFMSGYSANMIAHHGVLDEGVPFLQKPFSKQEIEMKIREILDYPK